MKKIIVIILTIFVNCVFLQAFALAEEEECGNGGTSAGTATNFLKDPRTENSEAVFNLVFDYRMPDIEKKFSFEQLVKQRTFSCFVRHGRWSVATGGYLSIEKIFRQTVSRNGLDPDNFILTRVQGYLYNAQPTDLVWWFACLPKKEEE